MAKPNRLILGFVINFLIYMKIKIFLDKMYYLGCNKTLEFTVKYPKQSSEVLPLQIFDQSLIF